MLCAVCLYEMHTHAPIYPTRLRAEEALTVANGQAVCEPHFIATCRKLSADFGQVGLSFLRDARSDRTPPADSP